MLRCIIFCKVHSIGAINVCKQSIIIYLIWALSLRISWHKIWKVRNDVKIYHKIRQVCHIVWKVCHDIKKVWKVCHDIKKVWNNIKMHVIDVKNYVMMSKSASWCQNVCEIRHDVKRYVDRVIKKYDMVSRCKSWLQNIILSSKCHQKVRHNAIKYIENIKKYVKNKHIMR